MAELDERIDQLEEAMQKVMDEYAGGIQTAYRYNSARLALAREKILKLQELLAGLKAVDTDGLLRIYEIRERLTVCLAVIAHLEARKETRWHSFAENADYPEKSDEGLHYVNSVMVNGSIKIIERPLVGEGVVYEHKN